MNLSAEAEARMRERVTQAPEARHGEHHYTAEAFGLDPAQISQQFAAYIKRHELA
ncbi:hypothetical protein D3C84_1243290 [compost metagenome]